MGVVTLVKETYLIASFIYKTINSSRRSEDERKEVVSQMRWELLVLQSFGRYFTRANGKVVGDVELDEVTFHHDIKASYESLLTTSAVVAE